MIDDITEINNVFSLTWTLKQVNRSIKNLKSDRNSFLVIRMSFHLIVALILNFFRVAYNQDWCLNPPEF